MIDILALLAAAVVAVVISTRLGLGSVLGYIAAGVAIGPFGAGMVTDAEHLRHIGEFGVVFLLFMIGLELKPKRLWIMRQMVFGVGGTQVAVCGAVFTFIAHYVFDHAWAPSVAVGFGFALSSTAFGMQLLSENNEVNSQHGRASFATLLFQDIAVVPMMIVLPLLAAGSASAPADITSTVFQGAIIVVAALVAGHYAIGPVLHTVARIGNVDTFIAFALLVVLGFAWAMQMAGLSLAMGAFMAGVLLAESEYRHQIEADILPFRGLLLGLFFMSVGMSLDPDAITSNAGSVVLGVVGLLLLKAALTMGVFIVWRLPAKASIRSAFLLSQAGEFGFVIFSLAEEINILADGVLEILIAVTVISMVLTPLMQRLGNRLAARLTEAASDVPSQQHVPERLVIVAGFGRVGKTVANMLRLAEVPYVAIDTNAEAVWLGRQQGFNVYFGSAAKPEVLRSVGAANARLLVVTLDNPSVAEAAVRISRRQYPNLPIHVRVHDWSAADSFAAMGVAHAMPETVESSLRLGAAALEAAGVASERRRELFEQLSADNFEKMREANR